MMNLKNLMNKLSNLNKFSKELPMVANYNRGTKVLTMTLPYYNDEDELVEMTQTFKLTCDKQKGYSLFNNLKYKEDKKDFLQQLNWFVRDLEYYKSYVDGNDVDKIRVYFKEVKRRFGVVFSYLVSNNSPKVKFPRGYHRLEYNILMGRRHPLAPITMHYVQKRIKMPIMSTISR